MQDGKRRRPPDRLDNGSSSITNREDASDLTDAEPLSDDRGDAPRADPACLYGLVGDVAMAGSADTETNPYAIAANFLVYLSCAVGRGVYLPIGNTWHHARIFLLHVGRSGRGRKGDAVSLIFRIDQALRELAESYAPQVHRGGLSSREGLVALMHDGYRHGQQVVPAIADKRLWVVESEFANVLHQGRRAGNTLSAALRDCWDGVGLKPATKTNRLSASNPHVCLSGAISPRELTALLAARDLTNGFANRFLMIWAERSNIVPFPKATPQSTVEALAGKTLEILEFVGAHDYAVRDRLRMDLSVQAQWLYAKLYRGELNDEAGDHRIAALLERRAPMLLRVAMLFALGDRQLRVGAEHVEAATAWVRYWTESVRYVFEDARDDERAARVRDLSDRVLAFLRDRGSATRTEISAQCLRGRVSQDLLDASLDRLLTAAPPKIQVQTIDRPEDSPGRRRRIYRPS